MSSRGVKVRAARPEDAAALAPLLRAQDKAEINAAKPDRSHYVVILRGVVESTMAWTFHVGDELAFVCGVAPYDLLSGTGVPWLLGTDAAPRHRHALMRLYPAYIAAMLTRYPRLENVVHLKNTASVRWLKRMGFSFGPEFKAPTGEPFAHFWMER